MNNQAIIIGRIVNDLEIKEENDRKELVLLVATPREYKNEDGIYETDFIDCYLYDTIAEQVKEYCKKGDTVGIRGRLRSSNVELENERTIKLIKVIVEKISFLSSKKDSVDEDNNTDRAKNEEE